MKRHKSLQPLSREHHHGLLLCWKIRQGIKKEIDEQRIKKYVDWFYTRHIHPHFEVEEKHVFTIPGLDHPMVKQVMEQHARLRELFGETNNPKSSLEQISNKLDEHIRFEERILFPKIQEMATESELKKLEEIHKDVPFVDNSEDEFWL